MDAGEAERLRLRGKLEELRDEIEGVSRAVYYNLVRPLRDRFTVVAPGSGAATPPVLKRVDVAAARHELKSLAEADARLDALLAEHNEIAARLGRPLLQR